VSTSKEIRKVLNDDISNKSQQVLTREGIMPFLEGMGGYHTEELYGGLLDDNDQELLARISERDKLEKEADKLLGVDDGNSNKK